jgi:hypothetical protein
MSRACSTHGEKLNAYRILARWPERKRPLWRPRRRWEDNKIDLGEIGCSSMDWVHLSQNRA